LGLDEGHVERRAYPARRLIMEKRDDLENQGDAFRDDVLRAAKREQQEHSRALVRSGARTQESMLFIPSDVVRASKVRRRTDEF
jgi:hypothetical protein